MAADLTPIQLEPLMRITVEVQVPLSVGDTPKGEVRVIPFVGGTFEVLGGVDGAPVVGTVLPGGTDWQTVRADGALEIRAHYALETDDGERIEVVSEGVRDAAPAVLARLAAGEDVPAAEYYFRTAVRMYTSAPRFAHLNSTLAVAVGERQASSVHLVVHRIP